MPSRRRPSRARGGRQGCTECRRFPLRAYNKLPPRPAQTGGGRSVTPSSTQLVSLGRLLLFGYPGRPSSSWWSLFGDRRSAPPDWTSCGAQYLGKTATRCPQLVFLPAGTRLDTGELMWAPMSRVGTRGQDTRWCRRELATTGAGQTPGHRPVTLSRRAARCWPLASLRGGQQRRHRMFSGLWAVACHYGVTEDRGSLSRLSTPVPGPRGGTGHTCGTPVGVVPGATEVAVRALLVAVAHWEPRCDRGLGRWPCSHIKKRNVPNATGITPSESRREVSAQGGDEHLSTRSEPDPACISTVIRMSFTNKACSSARHLPWCLLDNVKIHHSVAGKNCGYHCPLDWRDTAPHRDNHNNNDHSCQLSAHNSSECDRHAS